MKKILLAISLLFSTVLFAGEDDSLLIENYIEQVNQEFNKFMDDPAKLQGAPYGFSEECVDYFTGIRSAKKIVEQHGYLYAKIFMLLRNEFIRRTAFYLEEHFSSHAIGKNFQERFPSMKRNDLDLICIMASSPYFANDIDLDNFYRASAEYDIKEDIILENYVGHERDELFTHFEEEMFAKFSAICAASVDPHLREELLPLFQNKGYFGSYQIDFCEIEEFLDREFASIEGITPYEIEDAYQTLKAFHKECDFERIAFALSFLELTENMNEIIKGDK